MTGQDDATFVPHPLMQRWVRFVIRRRRWVVAVVVAITAMLAFHLPDFHVDNDMDIWAPQASPFVQTTKTIERLFGDRNTVVIGLFPDHGSIYQTPVLREIIGIQQAIAALPEAVRGTVLSLAARKAKAITGTSGGMDVHPLLARVPLSAQGRAALATAIAKDPFYIGSLVSPDGRAAAVIASFHVRGPHPSYARLYREIRAAVAPFETPGVRLRFGGGPIGYARIEYYTGRSPIYFGAALLIILAVQYWAFRSWQGMILPTVTALLSVVWGLGVLGLLGRPMDVLNTTTPILLMAMASGHAIQILKRYHEAYHKRRHGVSPAPAREAQQAAIEEALTAVGPVMVIAGLIASATFFSLTFGAIALIRHFGLLASAGVVAAVILELTLIPAVRAMLPPPGAGKSRDAQSPDVLDRLLGALARALVGGRAQALFLGSIGAIAVIGAGAFFIHPDSRLMGYFEKKSVIRHDDAALNKAFGGTNSFLLLVHGAHPGLVKEPRVLKAMSGLESYLSHESEVGKVQSIADIVSRINQALHGDDPAADRVPDTEPLVAQSLLLYEMSGSPEDFDQLVDDGYQNAVIRVYLKTGSTAYAATLYHKIRHYVASHFPPDVTVTAGGSVPETMAINDTVVHEKIENIIQMMVVVFILAALVFRSLAAGAFVVTPLALIVVANFGLMGWLGIPLDMGTAAVASMAIGIGADYEIYLLYRFREEWEKSFDIATATRESLLTSGKAIVFVALAVAGGYAALIPSHFAFNRRLATLVIATMGVSTVSALVFLRSMMLMFRPAFVFGRSTTASGMPSPQNISHNLMER